jgi:integrase
LAKIGVALNPRNPLIIKRWLEADSNGRHRDFQSKDLVTTGWQLVTYSTYDSRFLLIFGGFCGTTWHHFDMRKSQRRLEPSIRKRTDRKKRPWLLDLPPSLSETGARQRLHFTRKTEAERELSKRLRDKEKHGKNAEHIRPSLVAEAQEAAALLAPWNVSLLAAVKHYVAQRKREATSKPVREAWADYERLKENRSDAHREDIARLGRRLPEGFRKLTVAAVTPDDVKSLLADITNGATRHNKVRAILRNFFAECMTDGIATENPVEQTRAMEKPVREVAVLTVEQLKDVFAACQDYRTEDYDRRSSASRKESLDCRRCAVPFAVLALAGLRPTELTRLLWDDVSLELKNIRVHARNAKTRTLRNVHMEPALLAWLKTVPPKDRKGPVVPGDWRRKRAKVMREAGVATDTAEARQRLQDVFRHSYGSFHLGAFNDIDALKANMGHGHVTTYFNHYHNARLPKEALPWWRIGPGGRTIRLVRVA